MKWASLRRHSFRSGQTLSPARKKIIGNYICQHKDSQGLLYIHTYSITVEYMYIIIYSHCHALSTTNFELGWMSSSLWQNLDSPGPSWTRPQFFPVNSWTEGSGLSTDSTNHLLFGGDRFGHYENYTPIRGGYDYQSLAILGVFTSQNAKLGFIMKFVNKGFLWK